MQSELIIKKLSDYNDIQGIVDIENQCFKTPWSYGMLAESFDNHCNFWLTMLNGETIGYIGLYNSGDITNVAVMPLYRGLGIADKLIKTVIEYAKSRGIAKLFLEVRISNAIAIKLYEKNGFKQINARKKYYEDGEDALIFCLEVE